MNFAETFVCRTCLEQSKFESEKGWHDPPKCECNWCHKMVMIVGLDARAAVAYGGGGAEGESEDEEDPGTRLVPNVFSQMLDEDEHLYANGIIVGDSRRREPSVSIK